MPTYTVTRTVEIEVEVEVEVSGRFVPARTSGPPERCHPAEYPDAEIVSATCKGMDVRRLLSDEDEGEAKDEALEQAGEEDAGPDPDDEADRRREIREERGRYED